jgi:CheY-like chemotaxis protein
MALRAHEKGLELLVSIASDVPIALTGDPHRLRQVLVNLVGNAIKFTERGEVSVRVTNDPGASQPGTLRFMISDTGIGIPSDKLGAIFDRFSQADGSTTRVYGGTGLGLAICKQLIELMGGTIWVESALGKGSTFYFTAYFGMSVSYQASPGLELKGVQTLVISHHEGSRNVVEEVLKSWGASVDSPRDEESALIRLTEDGDHIHLQRLLLLDLGERDLDRSPNHKQLIKVAKDHGMKVIVFVSDVRSSNVRYSYSLGLDGYATKPLTKRKLEQVIGMAMQQRTHTSHEWSSTTLAQPDHSLAILLADDSSDNLFLIQAYLKHSGYHLDMAENGKVAFEMYRARKYDLVLMDVQMPLMDGYMATRMIRDWEQKANISPIPIIALTAHAYEEERQKSIAAGCSDHLTKPLKKSTLLNAIQNWIAAGSPEASAVDECHTPPSR